MDEDKNDQKRRCRFDDATNKKKQFSLYPTLEDLNSIEIPKAQNAFYRSLARKRLCPSSVSHHESWPRTQYHNNGTPRLPSSEAPSILQKDCISWQLSHEEEQKKAYLACLHRKSHCIGLEGVDPLSLPPQCVAEELCCPPELHEQEPLPYTWHDYFPARFLDEGREVVDSNQKNSEETRFCNCGCDCDKGPRSFAAPKGDMEIHKQAQL